MTTDATRSIAEFAVQADTSGLDPDSRRIAVRAFVDTVGVAIAGASELAVRALTEAMPAPAGSSVLLGDGTRTSAVHAALVNATAGHALDYDDHLNDVNGHPSIVLVPALLAMAEERRLPGSSVVEAYVVGHQVMCAIAAALPVRAHWTAGWHATGVVGVMAAATAASRLMGLDVLRTQYALGIAASLASGSRQNCGYTVKPLHAGMAASHGLLAASLAEKGYDADPEHLESPLGFFHLFGVDPGLERIAPVLAERWTVGTRGLNVKAFPACYAVHPAARAALTIARRGVDVESIDSVEITVQPTGLTGPIHHRPTTGLQAKFSIEYTVTAALLDGALTLSTFEDPAVLRSGVQRLIAVTTAHEATTPPIGDPVYDRWFATVLVRLTDGTEVVERADMPHGYARDPLSDDELDRKFLECASGSAVYAPGEGLLARLRRLDTAADVRDVLDPKTNTTRNNEME